MYQSEMFFPEAQASDKNNSYQMQMKDQSISPAAIVSSNMDLNYVNLLRENFELRERNNQLIKLNNTLMIEISQLKLEIDMLELKKALSHEDR